MSDKTMKTATLEEIREMDRRGELHHNPDAPEGPSLGADFWKDAELVYPEAKTPISLRVDKDVLDWFKAEGTGYQTRMNAVLRSFMEATRRKA
ncbi:BrnA antitoxin family protein [Aurantimonas sp. C2-6-R+9]|uniref:3-oxoacyl-ACP synthase n=2 Tax=root TaxID=1 RepID=A0A0F9UQR5_9ZZZZ|nr:MULTISPECIES: BrnA antitoxin family protein [unclassified Aurantimonas]MEC5292605.1 BrnA antitoxin family protein [Aurantimonas sp. C2-3-R2]MEC5322127.1 BrnA antitoxin family protein [Aurantimonas sp. A3-2-R12]MEC5382808.1 BrnA antitoxin family protein [Aurantimonas sp. C2-6-R+9]MEC5413660.1 BrnA antitoxin family protein [Aurantimonas sp. C2-4-R8]